MTAPRPRKGYSFVRQADGRIVYKYIDVDTGRWRAKRVPSSIISMPEAQAWIAHLFGYESKVKEATTIDKLRNLAQRATTVGERNAALNAILVLEAKQ